MSPDNVRPAYVLKMYPRLSETFILSELLAHEAAGMALEIYSLRPPVDARFHEDIGRVKAPITYLDQVPMKSSQFWTALRRARMIFDDTDAFFEAAHAEDASDVYQGVLLAEAVLARGITHLHAHFASAATSVARLASLLTGVPYTFTAHAKDIFHTSVDRDVLRCKLRDASAVITVSDFNVRFLADEFGGDAASVERLYNGLDLPTFEYRSPAGRSPLIIGVGRLVEKKGFADLISACDLLRRRGTNFRCEIVGHGALYGDLLRQRDELGLQGYVELLGPKTREEVIARIRESAVMAAPCVIDSEGNRDGLPTVLLEAMALGTPCVATDVTGIPELVRHGETGLIAGQHDPTSLADALQALLDDASERVRYAEAGRALIESEFDINTNTAVLREIFAGRVVHAGTSRLEAG